MRSRIKKKCGKCGYVIENWHNYSGFGIGKPFTQCPRCREVQRDGQYKEWIMFNEFDYIRYFWPILGVPFIAFMIVAIIIYMPAAFLRIEVNEVIIYILTFILSILLLFRWIKEAKNEINASIERIKYIEYLDNLYLLGFISKKKYDSIVDKYQLTRISKNKETNKYFEDVADFECSFCGARVGSDADKCPICGAKLVTDEELNEKFECSNCGKLVSVLESECPNCGAVFVEEEPEDELSEDEETFTCDNCGAEVDASAEECPKCGAKFVEESDEKPKKVEKKNNKITKKDLQVMKKTYNDAVRDLDGQTEEDVLYLYNTHKINAKQRDEFIESIKALQLIVKTYPKMIEKLEKEISKE